jgi:hypothetical protein
MMWTAMIPRKVLLVGAISLTAGWWVGTWTSTASNQRDAAAVRQQSGPRPLGSSANPAPLTRQLRERLDAQPPRTPATGRNPFAFGSRRPASTARQHDEPMTAPTATAPSMLPQPPVPQYRLSGIASSLVDGAPVLTAIINDHGALAFVKTGDKLSNGYSVVRVEDTAVVIVDAAGVTQTLRLP